MPNFNNITLAGHLARDIEIKSVGNDKTVAKTSIAVNNGYGDKKKTVFIDITCWNKTAEFAKQYLSKGSAVLINGQLELEQWEKDGVKRSKHSVTAFTVQSLDRKPETKQKTSYEEVPGVVDDNEIPF